MKLYQFPDLNVVSLNVERLLLQNGSPATVPLNPQCDDNVECPGDFAFDQGVLCGTGQNGIGVITHYFLPGQSCPTEQCTVIADNGLVSQELQCTNDPSGCYEASCDNVQGAFIICSGAISQIASCSGVEITVDCGPNDSTTCNLPL